MAGRRAAARRGEFTGPGKLTKGLKITQRLNTLAAEPATGLWIEDRGLHVRRSQIERTPRIGVDYAGPGKRKTTGSCFAS